MGSTSVRELVGVMVTRSDSWKQDIAWAFHQNLPTARILKTATNKAIFERGGPLTGASRATTSVLNSSCSLLCYPISNRSQSTSKSSRLVYHGTGCLPPTRALSLISRISHSSVIHNRVGACRKESLTSPSFSVFLRSRRCAYATSTGLRRDICFLLIGL